MAFPADYTLLGDLEVPTIDGTHTDYVALIKYNDFTTEMLSHLDNGGGDLRISDDVNGTAQLPLHVVEFDKVGNSVQAWVKIPSAFTGKKIYVWGDNTGDTQPAVTDTYGRNAVWSDYKTVLHLVESGAGVSGEFEDSTGNGITARVARGSSVQTRVGNPLGSYWQELDGIDDYITLEGSSGLLDNPPYSMSIWYQVLETPTNADGGVIGNWSNTSVSSHARITSQWDGSSGNLFAVRNTNETFVKVNNQPQSGDIVKATLVWDGSTLNAFENGVLKASSPTVISTISNALEVLIGTYYDKTSARSVKGRFGSVMISNLALDTDHIATEYDNQSANGWFIPSDAGGGATYTLNTDALTATVSINSVNLLHNKQIAINALSATTSINAVTLKYIKGYTLNTDALAPTVQFNPVNLHHNKVLPVGQFSATATLNFVNLIYSPNANEYTLSADVLTGSMTFNAVNLLHDKKLSADALGATAYFDDVALERGYRVDVNSLSGVSVFNTVQLLHNKQLTTDALSVTSQFNHVALNWSGMVDAYIDTYTIEYKASPVLARYKDDLFTIKFKE